MTLHRLLVPALTLAALSACIGGPGRQVCDTATGIGCDGDADVDVDADSDADADDIFDPWLFTVEMHTGFDGDDLMPYGIEGTEVAPYAIFRFYEEDYRHSQIDAYTCEWTGKIVQDGHDGLGAGGLWIGFDAHFEHDATAPRNTCDDWDPDEWADGTPTEAVETMDFGFGWAPLSIGMASELRDAYQNAGLVWEEVEPYIFGVYWKVDDRYSGTLVNEMGYGFATALDGDGNLAAGEDGEYLQIEVVGSSTAPAPAYISTYYYYGYEVDSVLKR
jgi:hypothetical protein